MKNQYKSAQTSQTYGHPHTFTHRKRENVLREFFHPKNVRLWKIFGRHQPRRDFPGGKLSRQNLLINNAKSTNVPPAHTHHPEHTYDEKRAPCAACVRRRVNIYVPLIRVYSSYTICDVFEWTHISAHFGNKNETWSLVRTRVKFVA